MKDATERMGNNKQHIFLISINVYFLRYAINSKAIYIILENALKT